MPINSTQLTQEVKILVISYLYFTYLYFDAFTVVKTKITKI